MDRETAYGRTACAIGSALTFTFAAAPAWAEEAAFKIDAADTAWMISATGLVLMMTIPGLALFYCGMVRKKNVLATMAQSFACTGLCSLLWFFVGYSLTFVGDDEADAGNGLVGWNSPFARALRGAAVGDLRKVMLPAGEREYEVIALTYP